MQFAFPITVTHVKIALLCTLTNITNNDPWIGLEIFCSLTAQFSLASEV